MGPTLRIALAGFGWSTLAYGALALRMIPGDYGHSLCGPWGCLPPLQALVAMHAFWLVVLTPAVVWADRAWTPRTRRVVGRAAVAIALVGLGAVVILDAAEIGVYFPGARGVLFSVWRALFALAMQTDIPLIPLLAAGIFWWVRGARTPAPAACPPPEPRSEGLETPAE